MRYRVPRTITRLLGDRSGNVAVMTALCAIPLFGMMGLAVDYSIAVSTKSKLDAAADAAVIAATTKAKAVINAGGTTADGIAQGQAQGALAFKANAGALSFGIAAPTPTVTITPNGQTLNTVVTYTLSTPNQFGGLFNVQTTAVGGRSTSSTELNPYYQFIFIVDVSGSMSIGGTPQDINGMVNDPNMNGCAFACHDPAHNRGPDYYAIAKQDHWTLKIDYVRTAIQTFITSLKTQTANIPGVFSVGIDTFASTFNVLQAPTTDIGPTGAAVTAAGAITIEPMLPLGWDGYTNQGYTQTTSSLNAALAQVTNIGDGTASTRQKTYFIFLSDGVEDIFSPTGVYHRGTDVTYTSACSTIINTPNATMISIIAPYPVVNDYQYPIFVAPIASHLVPAMQDCASAPTQTWSFQATDGPSINTAVQTVLQRILQGMTRLTQ